MASRGQAGLTVERAEGEATLRPGERVVLFLITYSGEGSVRRIHGGFQGRYVVAGDRASNEKDSMLLSELETMIQNAR